MLKVETTEKADICWEPETADLDENPEQYQWWCFVGP